MAGRCELRAGAVTAPALRGLSRFADARGIPAGREFWLDYDVIEAFCVAGLAGQACSTPGLTGRRCTGSRQAHGEPGQRATPFAGARAPAPYSPAERAELAAVAAAQRDPAKRASALAVVVFGIGAGLRPGELVALRGGDVTGMAGGWPCGSAAGRAGGAGYPGLCRAGGRAGRRRGRRSPVPAWPGGRGCKNFVTNFARALTEPGRAPAEPGPVPVQLHLRPPGRRHPGS